MSVNAIPDWSIMYAYACCPLFKSQSARALKNLNLNEQDRVCGIKLHKCAHFHEIFILITRNTLLNLNSNYLVLDTRSAKVKNGLMPI